ncbi:MAG: UDP-2,3-diacylglucosamine diphosphatase [Polaromonas sp.]|nr:UDP-2,3-diacylglucosamine diphosphatase [Polaromonas sp.]
MTAVPRIAELRAPPSWRTVDFISDLHLHAGEPATFAAWQHYMQSTPADAVFILGDLFEAWPGDDAVAGDLARDDAGFEDRCARVLGETAMRLPLFFMHGNRDFLVGPRLMDLCHVTLLDDPTVLAFAAPGGRWLLSHGDALCIGDTDYMAFRREVRSPAWQQAFLAKPLAERQALARQMRAQSEARKRAGTVYADVDSALASAWLQAADAPTLLHGHTHQPDEHALAEGRRRVVLSDWDAAAPVPRAEVLRLAGGELQRIPLL